MRHLLLTTTVSTLLISSGGVVAAQEEAESPQAGAFTPTAPLAEARSGHTATLLPDGRVLVTGGEGLDPEDLTAAEIWDPASGSFGPAEQLSEPRPEPLVEADIGRTGHTATLLPDGRALVIGGSGTDDPTPIAEAEVLDPESGELLAAGTLAEARSGHTATFLRDGRVLVVGGAGAEGPLASAELWTSATKPPKCLGQRPNLVAQASVELVGSKGNDVIAGTVGDDIIAGGGGNDRICGYGGDDTIDGGSGNDLIDGGPGADTVTGAGGNDRLTGAGGDDTLNGGKGKDVCVGGEGTDWLPGCNDRKATRGTVVVTRNLKLKGPHKGRFVIGQNGVTLDCDGHTVTGAGPNAGFLPAVSLVGRKRVTVRNCDLRSASHGIWAERSHRNSFSHNRVTNVGSDGFALLGARRNKLTGNTVSDSTAGTGFLLRESSNGNRLSDNSASRIGFGFLLIGSDENVLDGNIVADASDYMGYGIADGSDNNALRGNVATKVNGVGFRMDRSQGNTFTQNTASDNLGGYYVDKGSVRNTLSDNSSVGARDWGMQDITTGFRGDAGTDNFYSGNTCTRSGAGNALPASLCD